MLSSGLAARCRNARSGSYRRLEAARKATVPAGDACRPGNAGYPDVMPDVPGVRRGTLSHLAGTVRSRRGIAEARSLTRSEEHTSELQSLMSTSYAVFCLKKKNFRTSYPK